jgi:dihydrofolate reductase
MGTNVSIIVAKSENNVIGHKNELPWHLPNDLKNFKKVTDGHPVIMGRSTYDSLGRKPLPGRMNIVITKDPSQLKSKDGVFITNDLEGLFYEKPETETFIIGGAQIFKTCISFADKMYITEVHTIINVDGDEKEYTFFPDIDMRRWKEISRESHYADKNHNYDYDFVEYTRIK